MNQVDFVRLLDYKPKLVSEPNIDDISIIEFRNCKKRCPCIEFGTEVRKDKGGQYFYYEILDYGGYVEGDFISLTSNRRHDVIFRWPKTDDDFKKLAKNINASLKNLYKKDSKRSLDGKEWLQVNRQCSEDLLLEDKPLLDKRSQENGSQEEKI